MLKNNQKKWIIGGLIVVALLGLGGFVKLAIDNMYFQPHGYIEVVSIPEKVSYSYHETSKDITSGDKRPVPTGKYEITFSAEGYDSQVNKVTIIDGETVNIGIQLAPQSSEAITEYSDDKYDRPKEYTTAYRMDEETEDILEKNPIIDKLPILARDYTIEQCEAWREDTQKRGNIGICADTIAPEDYKDILDELSRISENLDQYDISINGIVYPTKKEREAGEEFTLLEPVDYGHGDHGDNTD